MNELQFAALPDVLTVDETAAFLRLGRSSVYEAIRTREIPAVRVGRRILVPKLAIERIFVDPQMPVSNGVENINGRSA